MIRVLEPDIRPEDIEVVSQSLKDGWVSWHGPYYDMFADSLEKFLGLDKLRKRIVLTSSGTTALHAALVLAKANVNTHLSIPELTYVATLAACRQIPLTMDFDDVQISDWNIDPIVWEKKYIDKVITVDLYGVPCRIPPSTKVIIEDACESLGAVDKEGKMCGTRGRFGVFSFFANKIITTGEGGALVVNEYDYQGARDLVNHYPGGLNYDHPKLGFNYRMTHMSAALGWSQMKRIRGYLANKSEIFAYYLDHIHKPIQYQLSSAESSHWASTFLFEDKKMRMMIEEALQKNEIEYRRIFKPMSSLFGNGKGKPIANDIYDRGLMLPSSANLSKEDQEFICKTINSV